MVIPVVIDALRTILKRIYQYVNQIDIPADIISIQETAILGTVYILRRVQKFKKFGRYRMSNQTITLI